MHIRLLPVLIELQDGAEELKNSPVRKATFEMEEKNTEDGLSESSSEGRSLPSPLEGSPSIEGNNCTFFFQIATVFFFFFLNSFAGYIYIFIL